MTLEGLKIFCDVVRQRSFSRGASINAVSQSAASQTILQLEKRLGVRLIDRSKRPLTLTPEGRVYYEGCRDIVDRYFAIEARTKSLHTETLSHVNVASIYSVGIYDMHQYVQRFLARHPRGNVRLDYLHPAKVYEKVVNEEADLGLISFPRSSRELEIIPWRQEPMVLVCYPAHPLTREAEVAVNQLDGENFIGFDAELTIRRHLDRFLRQRGVHVNVVMEFDNIEAIKRGIEIEAGISILPEPTVRREVDNGALVIVPVAGLDLVRPLCIVHRRGRVVTPAMSSFIELLTQGDGERTAGGEAGAGRNGEHDNGEQSSQVSEAQ